MNQTTKLILSTVTLLTLGWMGLDLVTKANPSLIDPNQASQQQIENIVSSY